MPGPDESGPASVSPSSAGAFDPDAPPSSGPVSARDVDSGPDLPDTGDPPASGTTRRVNAAILAFVASRKEHEGRDFIIRVIKTRLGADVSRALLDDIVQASLTEAVECRWPPWLESKIPAWLARLTRRQIAAHFRKEKGRQEENKTSEERREPTARPRDVVARNRQAARLEAGRGVEPAERTEWIADGHAPPTDERARARLIHDWLAKQIGGDPTRVHTLALLGQHEVDGFTLGELAERENTTERALANRFYKLRKELAPKVRRLDDERTRRSVIVLLLLLGITTAIAALVWLWLGVWPAAPPKPSAPRDPLPSPSVIAPPPVFNQALPPSSPTASPPAPPQPPRPQRDKP